MCPECGQICNSVGGCLKNQLKRAILQYNELVTLIAPQHLWTSTGARYKGHDDCETCDWLEKNTKLSEKAKIEKPKDKCPACAGLGMVYLKDQVGQIACPQCRG